MNPVEPYTGPIEDGSGIGFVLLVAFLLIVFLVPQKGKP
jgi:hypothetical protein